MASSTRYTKSLIDNIILAISEGIKRIVIWGINSTSIHILSFLNRSDLLSYISGLVDSRKNMQGQVFFGFKVFSPERIEQLELEALIITSDKNKEVVLEEFSRHDKRVPRLIFEGKENYEFNDPVYQEIVNSCYIKSRAGGYPNMLLHLYQALKYIAERNLKGDITEFGVYKAGTTVFIAKVLKHYGHPGHIYGFDSFSGFPPPVNVMDAYQEKEDECLDFEAVTNYCSPYNIELVQGDICETYTKINGIPLALSFFDTDNYSPTKKALELCFKQTVPGGILAFDHIYSPNWNKTIGERIAIKQVLEKKQVFNLHGTGIFIKI